MSVTLSGLPTFTVAQLDRGIGLEPRFPNTVENIRDHLKIESVSKPLVVETGAKLEAETWSPIIALFPLDKTGQEAEVT